MGVHLHLLQLQPRVTQHGRKAGVRHQGRGDAQGPQAKGASGSASGGGPGRGMVGYVCTGMVWHGRGRVRLRSSSGGGCYGCAIGACGSRCVVVGCAFYCATCRCVAHRRASPACILQLRWAAPVTLATGLTHALNQGQQCRIRHPPAVVRTKHLVHRPCTVVACQYCLGMVSAQANAGSAHGYAHNAHTPEAPAMHGPRQPPSCQ